MIKQIVRRFRSRDPALPEHEYIPEGWDRAIADGRIKGWNVSSVVDAQLERITDLGETLSSTQPLGTSPDVHDFSAADLASHNTQVSFAYVVALAAQGGERVSLLDWGGGVGQYGLIAGAVVPEVKIDYHCKEVPVQCEVGRRFQPAARFYTSDEQYAEQTFDLVMASGSLHYARDWRAVLDRLAAATGRYLYVTRLPVVVDGGSYVVVQRPYRYGYDTEYLGWCLSRDEFLTAAKTAGMKLVREFIVGTNAEVPGAPAPYCTRGFLFRPK